MIKNGQPWVNDLVEKYTSGVSHMFILHFNVSDYIDNTNTPKPYLSKVLGSMDIICFYNIAEGFTFPLPSMKNSFIDELNLKPEKGQLESLFSNPEEKTEEEINLPKTVSQALPLLSRLLQSQGTKSAVIIEFPEMLVPEGPLNSMMPEDRESLVSLQQWAKSPEIQKSGNLIILITKNLLDIHSDLRASSSRIESISLPLPDYQERLKYTEFLKDKANLNLGEISSGQFAMMTAGLSKIHIEDIKLRAEKESAPVTYGLIRDRKEGIIRSEYADVIEIIEPGFGFEMIGGMEIIKTFFKKNIIIPIQKGNYKRVPMGVLLTGPAGTGKSVIVQAVAKESGLNCVNLNLAKILGQYVGNSERNLEKALRCVEALAPCLVFVDEIDQSIQRGGSGDSGVSNRLFKRIMEFMSDTSHRGKIVFLAATNRPDLMDAALKRPGRFDKKIPCLIPDAKEREAIFRVMFAKYKILHDLTGNDFADAAYSTEGYTGAEIEAIVIKAYETSEDEGHLQVGPLDLIHALKVIRPSTTGIKEMTELAIKECDDMDFLPHEYQSQWKKEE